MLRIAFLLFFASFLKAQSDTLGIAKSMMQHSEYQAALTLLERYDQNKPYDVQVKKLIAENYLYLGNHKKAKSKYSEVYLYDSTDTEISFSLGTIFEQEGNFTTASKWYEKVVAINPNNPYYLKKAATTALSLKDKKRALSYFEQAYSHNHQIVLAEYCKLLIEEGHYYKADTILNIALNKDPEQTKLLNLRVTLNYRQNCFDEALEDLLQLQALADSSVFVTRMLGYVYFQKSDWNRLIEIFLPLIEKDPERAENTHYYLAVSYKKMGDYTNAIHHYKAAIAEGISPELGTYYQNLGEIYQLEGKGEYAYHAFTLANEFVQDGKTLFYLAQYAEINEKNKPKAIELYKNYLTSNDSTFKKSVEARIKYLETKK